MEKLLNVKTIHIQYLQPLLKWKILDLSTLMNEAEYDLHITGFQKIIQRLERLEVVKSFRDPWNKRKYIYLAKNGLKIFHDDTNSNIKADQYLVHDAKVVEIARQFLDINCFKETDFCHHFSKRNKLIPDCTFNGNKNGKSFKMAFELEITRKSHSRIEDKIEQYLESSKYDYIFYLFCNKLVFESYIKLIKNKFDQSAFNRLMFFWNPTIFSKEIRLNESIGIFKMKEVKFHELFN